MGRIENIHCDCPNTSLIGNHKGRQCLQIGTEQGHGGKERINMPIAFVTAVLCLGQVWVWADVSSDVTEMKEEKIQLTFSDNVTLKTLVDYVAVRLGKNIMYEESLVSRTLTIRSPVPVDRNQLFAILRSALRVHGLALVEAEQKGWLKIIQDVKLAKLVPFQLVHPSQTPDVNSVVTQMITLKYIPAKRFVELVGVLLSKPGGNLIALQDGQTLIVTDYKVTVDALIQLQKQLDLPTLKEHWKIVRIKHTPIARIAESLKVITQKIVTSTAKQNKGEPVEAVIPIAAINAFLLKGTVEQISQIESLIALFDIPVKLCTRIYTLRYASPERSAKILKQLALPLQQSHTGTNQWVITPDPEANALVVTCPQENQLQVEAWIKNELDQPSDMTAAGLNTRMFEVKYARADEIAATISSVFSFSGGNNTVNFNPGNGRSNPESPKSLPSTVLKTPTEKIEEKQPLVSRPRPSQNRGKKNDADFNLTVHPATNSIIITAANPVLNQVERLVRRLDRHRPQVLIDVTIISVNQSKTFDLGVELNILQVDEETGLLTKGLLSKFGLFSVDPVTTAVEATFGTGLNAVLLRPNQVSLILRAFRSRLEGQVIARPRLLIDDNAAGYLSSVTEQPFTSINIGDTVSTTTFAGYQEAGTQISIKPHISEGDVVNLEYEILSSSFTGASTDANIPPPRAKDSVSSRVTIPSGYFLLVGGLTRENQQKSRSEIPYLADIPGLGELFRTRSDNTSRTVLYIFIRPKILRGERFAYLKFISKGALIKAKQPSNIPAVEMEFLR